jgi:hypothetical protein
MLNSTRQSNTNAPQPIHKIAIEGSHPNSLSESSTDVLTHMHTHENFKPISLMQINENVLN